MSQLGLFDPYQDEELTRVRSRIGAALVDFCRGRGVFHADDLRAYVTRQVGSVAPGSADRILRDLRQRGVIDYEVINRRASLYRVLHVDTTP